MPLAVSSGACAASSAGSTTGDGATACATAAGADAATEGGAGGAAEAFGSSLVLHAGVENAGEFAGGVAGVLDVNDGAEPAAAAVAISFFGDQAGAGGAAEAR